MAIYKCKYYLLGSIGAVDNLSNVIGLVLSILGVTYKVTQK